jgi:PPOX class probable F420-dependent enzyme
VVPGGGREVGDLLRDDLAAELLDARLIANLATVNRDGSIHLVAMWFLRDNETLLIPTSRTTRKLRNLERNPHATVMIDDSRGGFDLRGITLVGSVEIVRGEPARTLNRCIHLKYVTEDGLNLNPVREYLSGDDVTIRFRPERVSTWDLRSTDHGRALRETGLHRALD